MYPQKHYGQSAYRKFHSAEESVLLKVENNIALSLDKGRVTALTLLNLPNRYAVSYVALDSVSSETGVKK